VHALTAEPDGSDRGGGDDPELVAAPPPRRGRPPGSPRTAPVPPAWVAEAAPHASGPEAAADVDCAPKRRGRPPKQRASSAPGEGAPAGSDTPRNGERGAKASSSEGAAPLMGPTGALGAPASRRRGQRRARAPGAGTSSSSSGDSGDRHPPERPPVDMAAAAALLAPSDLPGLIPLPADGEPKAFGGVELRPYQRVRGLAGLGALGRLVGRAQQPARDALQTDRRSCGSISSGVSCWPVADANVRAPPAASFPVFFPNTSWR
jgi:hypothetical protein